MAQIRFKALEEVQKRKPIQVEKISNRISDYFKSNVYSIENMRDTLPPLVVKNVELAIQKGQKIDRENADVIASGMKNWAIEKGVTHFTHWFQPLTGTTAEKHDAFFETIFGSTPVERFKGSSLVQQEPDASSFPSGGLRNTFEARGYTAWDPTSPAFIMETISGKTLCIPTIFVAYTGEALDFKAPLLKSLTLIDQAATKICNEYFDKNITKVTASLGIEQEYFLIDKALYFARPDLIMTGRTVFGHAPARGQQLDDHYFGSIPSRVQNFMIEMEKEAHKLGIPLTTRHNEVAPGQFECAPIFEEANLAVDHNQLLMDIIDKAADKHGFKALLHEKPFAGINGSGKHNNWALSTNTGKNLLQPTSKAKENLLFLTFFINTIKAVHDHASLLRASIASASNDHRLGANEAPPAIMSVFIGSQLTEVIDELEKNATIKIDKGDNMYMKLGIDKIPEILMDNTDRNRTSPFAFTGNKFEFRAVGSSANCAQSMTVLNAIVAKQLRHFYQDVEKQLKKHDKKEVAIINVLREYIKLSKKIRFEGNGYGDEWAKEAEKRGLPNIKTTPHALDAYVSKENKAMYTELGIYTIPELEARHEIMLENYTMKIQIEGRVIGDLALNHIVPTAINYQNKLINNVKGLKEIGIDIKNYQSTLNLINEISEHIYNINKDIELMTNERKKANNLEKSRDKAIAYCEKVRPFFDTIRYHVDKLELIIDDEDWPLAKYRELLFLR